MPITITASNRTVGKTAKRYWMRGSLNIGSAYCRLRRAAYWRGFQCELVPLLAGTRHWIFKNQLIYRARGVPPWVFTRSSDAPPCFSRER